MTSLHTHRPRASLLTAMLVGCTLLPLAALAQDNGNAGANAKEAPTTSDVSQGGGPASGGAPTNKNDVVTLTPFEVSSSEKGYATLNSNSITQFKTDLGKMPVSADIFDAQFMDDVGTMSAEQMVQEYSAGAGAANSSPGAASANSQGLDRNGNSFLSLRGVTAPTMLRDGLMPLNTFFGAGSTSTNYTSLFDTESLQIINGPQALLYGVGGAGGVINVVSKRANFDQDPKGQGFFSVDEWGHKDYQFDYGMGSDHFAIRLATINQEIGARRTDIGGPMAGQYIQAGVKFWNTEIRVTAEQTDYLKQGSDTINFTGLSTANDARNGNSLRWLLFSGQLPAAANGGASGAGNIANGTINWNNIDSYAGDLYGEDAMDTMGMITIDTKWTSWLSTEAQLGYRQEYDDVIGNGGTVQLVAPNVAANPTGAFAVSDTQTGMLYEPTRVKTGRISAVAKGSFFHGIADSTTVAGVDYTRADGAVMNYGYVTADSNFNPIQSTTTTTQNGYTYIPTVYWAVPNGPVHNPLWTPLSQHITYNGVNYVLQELNAPNPADVSPSDPLGLTGHGTNDYRIGKSINGGVYFANYTNWWNDKLTSLVGMRIGHTDELNQTEKSSTVTPSTTLESQADTTSFNFGLNYKLTNWLRPYITVSNSYDPPPVLSASPDGLAPGVAHAIGEEAGFKLDDGNGKVSGSILWFHTNSKNEQYSFTSTLTNDINPAGLNGTYGAISNFVNVNRETQGTQATITANPTPNWTMRFSAAYIVARIDSNVTYPQLYNDQFYENAAGDVTYSDGTLVYVNPTATKAALLAQASGGVPLTVTMMNTSTSAYYANPAQITSAINSSSGAATILKMVDPVHGGILTGATGLPISALQIAPNPTAPPPGSIILGQVGDYASQTPMFSFNYTTAYTFSTGVLRGLKIGGTVSNYWRMADYYFYPSGVGSPNVSRVLYYQPDELLVNGLIGYRYKFRRVTFLTQLNINNMFNHYHVYDLPNPVTGWNSGGLSVTFDQQPRSYTWSTTVKF